MKSKNSEGPPFRLIHIFVLFQSAVVPDIRPAQYVPIPIFIKITGRDVQFRTECVASAKILWLDNTLLIEVKSYF